MLATIGRVLFAAVAAALHCVDAVLGFLGALLGVQRPMARPPAAMMQPPNSPANPVADNMARLQRNTTLTLRWAADCVNRGRAQVPAELPPAIKMWMEDLSIDEVEKLVIAGLPGIRAHLNGTVPVVGVMPIGGVPRRPLPQNDRQQDELVALPVPSF